MSDASAAKEQSGPQEKRPSRLREALIVVAAFAVGGVLLFGIYAYWNFERDHPATDNAYLQANYIWVSPQIDGQIAEIHVVDNQLVAKDDPLFTLDQRYYDAELQAAQANLVLVQQDIKAGKARVDAAKSLVTAQEAVVALAQQKADRSRPLVTDNVVSELQGIELDQTLAEEKAKLAAQKADLVVAQEEYGTPETIKAQLDKAKSAVELAKLNQEWTVVRAPAAGYVTNFAMRVGDVVESADDLFPFVETDEWWIQANFKETSIDRIKPGQAVTVTVDMYSDKQFTGTVQSLGSASAASFSLLPAQNTTGNWVKVTQRMPVRIALEAFDEDFPYRLGASASVEVNTDATPSNAAKSN